VIGVLHALEGEQPEAAQRKDSVCPPMFVGTEHGIAGTRENERGDAPTRQRKETAGKVALNLARSPF
jgi:hypothetical protein